MDMDDVWLKGIIIQSNTGSISQIAPGNDECNYFFLPESMWASYHIYADASRAQKPINQIKALIIADKKFKIH